MAQDGKTAREDRLKAALKANMSRRKAQKRVRAQDTPAIPQDGPEFEKPKFDEQEKTNG
jgi:hypothetical protein